MTAQSLELMESPNTVHGAAESVYDIQADT